MNINPDIRHYVTRQFLEEQVLYHILMYLPLEKLEIKDRQRLEEIMTAVETRYQEGRLAESDKRLIGNFLPAIQGILKRRTDLSDVRIQNLSWLDYDWDGKKDYPPNGLLAATFVNVQADALFVTFRGTPRGAWLDNAKMLIGSPRYCQDFEDSSGHVWHLLSPMQAEAMEYTGQLVGNRFKGWDQVSRHYVIGHSKGGNQAQLAMMLFPDVFEGCISMDGPGMSAETIREMQQKLGEEAFNRARGRLLGINAANDYVHGLGIPLIPVGQNVWFLETACTPVILCSHFITAFLAEKHQDIVPFNDDGPGTAAILMRKISDAAMAMPLADRTDVFMTLMAVLQTVLGKSLPVNAAREDWLRLIAGFEGGGIKTVSLLTSIMKEEGGDFMSLFQMPR